MIEITCRSDCVEVTCIVHLQGYEGFSGFHFSMLLLWLLRSRKINKLMSSYQIFRIALQTISTGDWTTVGLTFVPEDEQDRSQVQYDPVCFILLHCPQVSSNSSKVREKEKERERERGLREVGRDKRGRSHGQTGRETLERGVCE